jgi:hypothetical protein
MTRVVRTRFPGGLFITETELHEEKIVFRIFASRPTRLDDLKSRFTLSDDVGTEYVLETETPELIDGKAALVFTPGPPPAARRLSLSEPGRSLVLYSTEDSLLAGFSESLGG